MNPGIGKTSKRKFWQENTPDETH
ncbi:hypothetical protein, partial [Salmonella enterica]